MLVQLSNYFGQAPDEISSEQLKEYLYFCKEKRGLSNSFINQTISAVKILKRDVVGTGWDETIKVKRPRKDHHLPDILSHQQVISLISTPANVKHRAILAVLYSSGIRINELINLKLIDIDSTRMVIRVVNGKGNKSRDTLLAVKTLQLLREYYQCCHPKPLKYVFEGGNKPESPYSASSVRRIIKRSAEQLGIQKNISPHSLRHAFATHMLEQGANLKLIQKLMGHSSLSSTMVYLHLAAIDPSVKSPFDHQ